MFSLLDAVFPFSSNSDAATDMVTVIIPDSSFAQALNLSLMDDSGSLPFCFP